MASEVLESKIKITADAAQGIAAFKSLKTSIEQTKSDLSDATANIKALVQAANVGKLKLLSEAQADADAAAKKIVEAKQQLEFFKRSSEIGGAAGIKLFGKDIDKARDSIKAASDELQKHNQRIVEIQSTAATAFPEYAKQIAKAKVEAGKLKDSVDAQAVALEQSRRALTATGTDVTKLASEEIRLRQTLAQTNAEAARSAEIDRARATVGVQAHESIRASIAKVQAAYITLKESGTLSHAELAQAANRTRTQIAGMAEDFNGAKTAGEKLGNAFGLMRGAFIAFQAAIAGNAIVQAVDDLTRLESRLKLSEGSARAASTAMAGITRIAQEAGIPIRDLGSSYVRFSNAIAGVGGSQEQTIKFTDALAKALKISGASAEEALSLIHI